MTIDESRMRSLLVRAMQTEQHARIRNILAEYKKLACRTCGEANVSVHPQQGWGVTVMCEAAACQGVHSVLI